MPLVLRASSFGTDARQSPPATRCSSLLPPTFRLAGAFRVALGLCCVERAGDAPRMRLRGAIRNVRAVLARALAVVNHVQSGSVLAMGHSPPVAPHLLLPFGGDSGGGLADSRPRQQYRQTLSRASYAMVANASAFHRVWTPRSSCENEAQ